MAVEAVEDPLVTPAEHREGEARVRRVKISDALLDELRHDWSEPVQVRVRSMDANGDLELIFQTVSPADDKRVLLEEIEMHKRARVHLTELAAKKERRAGVAENRERVLVEAIEEHLAANQTQAGIQDSADLRAALDSVQEGARS